MAPKPVLLLCVANRIQEWWQTQTTLELMCCLLSPLLAAQLADICFLIAHPYSVLCMPSVCNTVVFCSTLKMLLVQQPYTPLPVPSSVFELSANKTSPLFFIIENQQNAQIM
jgi:hypothetical protein